MAWFASLIAPKTSKQNQKINIRLLNVMPMIAMILAEESCSMASVPIPQPSEINGNGIRKQQRQLMMPAKPVQSEMTASTVGVWLLG